MPKKKKTKKAKKLKKHKLSKKIKSLDEYIDNVEQKTKYLLDISKYDYTLNIKTGKNTEAQIKYNCEYFPLFDIDSYSKFSKKKSNAYKKNTYFPKLYSKITFKKNKNGGTVSIPFKGGLSNSEVAEKILGKSYGRLSIISNYRLKSLTKFDVSPNCFFPKPKVTSTVIHLAPKIKIDYNISNIENLEFITNNFFSNKRKKINKKIKEIFNPEQINRFKDLNLNHRPSDLKKEFYYQAVEIYESG